MKRTIITLVSALALLNAGPAMAGPAQPAKTEWKGQIKSDYVRKDRAFQLLAEDQSAWEEAWRMRLDRKPPRPLGDGETGIVLIGGPRPTPGYTIRYEFLDRSADSVSLRAWVESPEVVMFPASSNSHPYRVLVIEGKPGEVHVEWRE